GAVIELAVGELLEIGHGVRRGVVIQLGRDRAADCVEGGGLHLILEIRDTRYEIRDTRYEIRDTRYETRKITTRISYLVSRRSQLGHRSHTTHASCFGRLAMQTLRPCQMSRCESSAQSSRGKSGIRSRSTFSGSSWRVKPRS